LASPSPSPTHVVGPTAIVGVRIGNPAEDHRASVDRFGDGDGDANGYGNENEG